MSGLSDLQCQAIVLAFGRALDAVVRPVAFTDADESLSVSALGFADVLLLRAGRLSAPCGVSISSCTRVLKRLMTSSRSFWRLLSSSSGSLSSLSFGFEVNCLGVFGISF